MNTYMAAKGAGEGGGPAGGRGSFIWQEGGRDPGAGRAPPSTHTAGTPLWLPRCQHMQGVQGRPSPPSPLARKGEPNYEHDEASEAEVGAPTAMYLSRALLALPCPLQAGRSAGRQPGAQAHSRPPPHLCPCPAIYEAPLHLAPPPGAGRGKRRLNVVGGQQRCGQRQWGRERIQGLRGQRAGRGRTRRLPSSAASVLSSSCPRSRSLPSMASVLLFSCAAIPASSSVRSSCAKVGARRGEAAL